MRKIASILCDGGETRKDFRRNIYLANGRLICDGNDITPGVGRYLRGAAGREQAIADVVAMYQGGPWELETED